MLPMSRKYKLTFESLLHIHGLLGASLEVWNAAFCLAEGHGSLRRDLEAGQPDMTDRDIINIITILLLSSISILLPSTT